MPGSLPKVTDSKISNWVGGTYAQRGRSYFRSGRVVDLRWRGEVLMGEVQGSEEEPYTVRVKFVRKGKGIEGDCSCPMGYDCKHVAALLYAYASAPPAKAQGETVDKALAQLDLPALRTLVKTMLVEAPELEALIEAQVLAIQVGSAPVAAGDELALRQEVQHLLRRLEKPAQARAAERGLEALYTRAATLVKLKNWEAAQTILLVLLSELMLVSATSPSSEVDDVLSLTIKEVLKCWQALPADHPMRHDSLRGLFDFIALEVHHGWGGVYGLSETILRSLIQNATPVEREQLQEWMALAMRQPPRSPFEAGEVDLEYDDLDEDDTYLRSIWTNMLKRFGATRRPKTKPKVKPTAKRRTKR